MEEEENKITDVEESSESGRKGSAKQIIDKKTSVRFLLAEHQYFRESLRHNEEVGEKRVNYFISLTTAMITAFVAIMSFDITFITIEQLLLITVVAMVGLLVIGWLTMLRILKRNKNTDKCKERLDLVRKLFREFDESETLKESYWPYGKAKIKKPGDREWGSGGLREMIIAMNSIITVVIIVIVLELTRRIFYSTWIGGYFIIFSGGILASVGAWKIQKWLVDRNVNKKSKSNGEPKRWEWRIFLKDLNNIPWKSLVNGEKNPIEGKFKHVKAFNQSDCYFNLGTSNTGLKIRGIKSNSSEKKSPKLELKVLQDKIGDIECWKKTISKSIINVPIDNITDKIQISKARKRIRANYYKKTGNWKFYKKFISNPKVVIIEQTKGTVNIQEKVTKNIKFKTVSIESESFKLVQRFKKKFIQIENEDVIIYSYPEYILSLLKFKS